MGSRNLERGRICNLYRNDCTSVCCAIQDSWEISNFLGRQFGGKSSVDMYRQCLLNGCRYDLISFIAVFYHLKTIIKEPGCVGSYPITWFFRPFCGYCFWRTYYILVRRANTLNVLRTRLMWNGYFLSENLPVPLVKWKFQALKYLDSVYKKCFSHVRF